MLLKARSGHAQAFAAGAAIALEGVAVEAVGNIYGAEVGPMRLMKYVKRSKSRSQRPLAGD
jgi:hypothetical protein